MSFPPNLGFTNSLIIESDYYLLFQEFPSILPTLNQISSPFSKNRMINNGYSRIDQKKSNTTRSKSVDFADLTSLHHKPIRSTPKYLLTDSTREMTEPNAAILKIHDSIPEHEVADQEVFGIILSRKPTSAEQEVGKRSLSVRRSASVCEGYSRKNDGLISAEEKEEEENDDDQYVSGLITHKRRVKKKGRFFVAFKRLFGL